MTRISNHLLVQRVELDLVIIDESSGEEVVVPLVNVRSLVQAIIGLYPHERMADPA